MSIFTKHISLAVLTCLINCFLISIAFGCRYSVRDIGFTDLGSIPYRLYFFTQNNTPEGLVLTFKRLSYAALLDANVEAEIINIDQQTEHPALEHFHFWKIKTVPVAILVAPEAQSMVLPVSFTDKNYKESVWSLLENIVSSPTREEILEHIVKAYGLVLLIHGKDPAQNKNAQNLVTSAIDHITRIMDQMPKSVDEPPRLIVIPQKRLLQEKILLWSIGVNYNELHSPHVVILYGRGRRIGPIFKGDEITERGIFNVLSFVGANCECGLDRSLMLGTMIPHRWKTKLQSELVKRLGFDPESPIVKAEISRILAFASYWDQTRRSDVAGKSRPYGYSEGVVEFEGKSDIPRVSMSQFQESQSQESFSGFRIALFISGGIFLMILTIGIFILIKGYFVRRKSIPLS